MKLQTLPLNQSAELKELDENELDEDCNETRQTIVASILSQAFGDLVVQVSRTGQTLEQLLVQSFKRLLENSSQSNLSSNSIPKAIDIQADDVISYYIAIYENSDEASLDEWSKHLEEFWSWLGTDSIETTFYTGIVIGMLFKHIRVSSRWKKPKQPISKNAPFSPQLLLSWMSLLRSHYTPTSLTPTPSSTNPSTTSNSFSLLASSGESDTKQSNYAVLSVPLNDLPHLAVFSWVCCEYLTYFPTETLPSRVSKWLFSFITDKNVPVSHIVVHKNNPALSTIIDALTLRLKQQHRHLTFEDINKYAVQLREVAQTSLSTIKSKKKHDDSINLAVLRSSLEALTELAFKRASSFYVDRRINCWNTCKAVLEYFEEDVSRIPVDVDATPKDVGKDWAVRICAEAMRAMTKLAYRQKDNNQDVEWLKKEQIHSVISLIYVFLRPLSFRWLHRNLIQSAIDLINRLSARCLRSPHFKMINQEFLNSGITLGLRLQQVMLVCHPRWIGRKQAAKIDKILGFCSVADARNIYLKPNFSYLTTLSLEQLITSRFQPLVCDMIFYAFKLMLPMHSEYPQDLFSQALETLLPQDKETWPAIQDFYTSFLSSRPDIVCKDKPLGWTKNFWLLRHLGLTTTAAIESLRLFGSEPQELNPYQLISSIATRLEHFSKEEDWQQTLNQTRLKTLAIDVNYSNYDTASKRFKVQSFWSISFGLDYIRASFEMCGIPSKAADYLLDEFVPSNVIDNWRNLSIPDLLRTCLESLPVNTPCELAQSLQLDVSQLRALTSLYEDAGAAAMIEDLVQRSIIMCGSGESYFSNQRGLSNITEQTSDSTPFPNPIPFFKCSCTSEIVDVELGRTLARRLGATNLQLHNKTLYFRGTDMVTAQSMLEKGVCLRSYDQQDFGTTPSLYFTTNASVAISWAYVHYKKPQALLVFALDKDLTTVKLDGEAAKLLDLKDNEVLEYIVASRQKKKVDPKVREMNRCHFILGNMTDYGKNEPDPWAEKMIQELGSNPIQLAAKDGTECYLAQNLVGIIQLPPSTHD